VSLPQNRHYLVVSSGSISKQLYRIWGSAMRIVVAVAIILASAMLGGCFHHNAAAYSEPLPPPAHPPLK
jgi:hypothetical protein